MLMDRPRRIAFLSEHASPLSLLGGEDAGGQNVYVDEVSRNLGRLGYAVDVFTRRDGPDVPDVVDWAPDRLIAQCPSERAELVDDYGADPRKVVVIPSAVDVETFRPVPRDEARRALGLDTHELIVVYVGRMLPRKDVRNVVRAVALLIRQASAVRSF